MKSFIIQRLTKKAKKNPLLNGFDSWASTKLVMNAQTICFSGRLSARARQRQLPERALGLNDESVQPLFTFVVFLKPPSSRPIQFHPLLCAPVTVMRPMEIEGKQKAGRWLDLGSGPLYAVQSVPQWVMMSGAREAVCVPVG